MPPKLVHHPSELDFDTPGKRHYQVAFHLDSSWGYSLVPLTVIVGHRTAVENTPGVAVFGGTHGNEYEGQVGVKRLCADLDPEQMSGLVVLVPQLSESACRAHVRCSPEDGVNMNRAFPGNPRGTLSYRISHFVKTVIFPRVRVVLDLHAGGREANFPICTSLHPLPDQEQFRETVTLAKLFDTPFVFVYSRSMASGLLTDEAEDEGKIALGGEFGHAESTSVHGVRHIYEGVQNILRHYGMLDGSIAKVDRHRAAEPRLVSAPHLADYIPCPEDGIWEPLVVAGQDVAAGELIGRIHRFDDHTSVPIEVHAHKAGVVIALYFAATCRKGLTLFVIGEDAEAPK